MDNRDTRGPAPARSLTQRMTALEEANRIRIARSRLKRRIKREGMQIVILALELDTRRLGLEYASDLDTMKVWDLVIAAPKLGRVKVNRLLATHRISPSKTLGGLSARQRGELISALRPSTPAPPAFYRAGEPAAQEGHPTR